MAALLYFARSSVWSGSTGALKRAVTSRLFMAPSLNLAAEKRFEDVLLTNVHKRSKPFKKNREAWKQLFARVYPEDAATCEYFKLFEDLNYKECSEEHIIYRICQKKKVSLVKDVKLIMKEISSERKSVPSEGGSKETTSERKGVPSEGGSRYMVDENQLIPENLREDSVFIYISSSSPKIVEGKAPDEENLSPEEVNSYLGRVVFKAQGSFVKAGSLENPKCNIFFFEFESRQPCHDAKLPGRYQYGKLFKEVKQITLANVHKMRKNLFVELDKSPGSIYFENGVSKISFFDDSAEIRDYKLSDGVEKPKPRESLREESLTRGIYDTVIQYIGGINPEFSDNIYYSSSASTSCCNFSGGGDISFIGNTQSAVISVCKPDDQCEQSEDEHDALLVNESSSSPVVAGCLEGKLFERDNEKLLGQLVANMTVCIARSLRLMPISDVCDLKTASCYGLLLDRIQPIQMYRYTMDFRRSDIMLELLVSFKAHSPVAHEIADRCLSHMITKVFSLKS